MKKEPKLIYLASDHAGFKEKEKIKEYLSSKDIPFEDLGPYKLNISDDYPDFASKVAKKVGGDNQSFGLLICGTGVGMCITANKFPGIMAVAPVDLKTAKLSREHNNTNVLCLSSRLRNSEQNKKILSAWMNAQFSSASRHKRRLQKIKDIEKSK